MKITVWLVTRERVVWITGAEILLLGVLLLSGPGPFVRFLIGLPLLVHLGYRALTGLPMGLVPGRPEGGRQRRHFNLRERVVLFMNEVRRVEEYVQRAQLSGRPEREVDEYLQTAQRRMMAAAAKVVQAAGRADPAALLDDVPAEPVTG